MKRNSTRNSLQPDKRVVFHGQTPGGATSFLLPPCASPSRVFLLSPADASGRRAKLLLAGSADFDLAERLKAAGAPLGEVFSFVSGLYFRGKLTYAQTFARPPLGAPGTLIITPSRGLLSPETIIAPGDLHEMSLSQVHPDNSTYRLALERDAQHLAKRLDDSTLVVLLGSIATSKYVEPLQSIFGPRLCFPSEFVGRGDLSRGGLLLRHSRLGCELNYVAVANALRHGPRPARLSPVRPGKKHAITKIQKS
jgi:hypothetical protein